jgi:frataxin-like iron-binding protein CyaY
MDARVDTGHLDTYELDDNKGVRFEVFTGNAEPALAMTVGRDVEGGSTLLRLSGSDDVYRARVGGAFRFRKDAAQWRNRSVLDLDDALVSGLTIEGAGGVLTFLREPSGAVEAEGRPSWAPWHLQRDPTFPVDQRILEALARSLARLRASAVHAPDFGSGWDRPAGAYEVALSDGTTHRILVVPAPEGATGLARVDERPDVYRVAGALLERLEMSQEEYRDRTLFAFVAEQVDTLTLEEGSARVRIRQDPGTRLWRVVEPVSTEVDLRTALVAVRTMGELRAAGVAEGIDPRETGLVPPRARYEARLTDGSSQVLEVGARFQESGQDRIWVRRLGRDTVWVLPAETLKRMRAAFLQG